MVLVIGSVSAVDSLNVVDKEDSNLISNNDNSLSAENKLEISSEYSISETNIVNSHDDNLGNYPEDEVLNIGTDSNGSSKDLYVDNNEIISSNDDVVDKEVISSSISSTDRVSTDISSSNVVGTGGATVLTAKSATVVSTKLSISNTHYAKSATTFKVTLKDKNDNPLSNQKVSLKVNNKVYSAFTNAKGIALIKTASLKVGTYAVTLSYGGNENYSSSSLSRKVKVSSSISGKDLTKYAGYTSKFVVKFWKDDSVLAHAKITYKYKGKTHTRTTNGNGEIVFNVFSTVGKFVFAATNPYSQEKVSYNIVVKKDKTNLNANSKTYVHTNKKGSFSVVLKSAHDALLKNKKISFTFNNKTVTSKTDANGKATITIPVLAKGTHQISFKFEGNDNFKGKSGKASIVVADAKTKLSSKVVVMHYNDGSKFHVKLTDNKGKPLANKDVKIILNGITSICKTNNDGTATLSLKDIKPGNYLVKYHYAQSGSKYYSSGSKRVIILQKVAKVSASDLTIDFKKGGYYKVTVKDESGNLLKDVYVKSTINGKSYIYQTDSNGVAKLKIDVDVGCYSIQTLLADPIYKSAPVTKQLVVKGAKFIPIKNYFPIGNPATFSLKVVNEKNKILKGKKIVFTYKGKTLTAKTNKNGIAKVDLGVVSKGSLKIKYKWNSFSGSSKVFILNKVAINDIIKASKNVKSYISKYSKLPKTVKIGNAPFKTADYLYLASKAIVKLKSGNKKAISLKILNNPKKAQAATNLGYLKDYLSVAKSVVKTAESKGIMPNSVSSQVGTIGYQGIVSTFANILSYYGNNKKMPTYTYVESFKGCSPAITGVLNFKNTIKDLAPYLAASKNCEINDAQIKKLVLKLTKNCKSDKEKANVIYNYVRDKISYSFYYNTRYGAAGTLKAKHGNCVDQAHLVVAMCRCAGLPTMYCHGTCHFSSGNTYGHVWGMVLIGKTWTVVDPVSTRNSLGKVVNWNTHSYVFKGYHISIQF